MLAFVLVFSAFSSAVIAEASEKTTEEQMLEALGKTPENAKLDYVIDAPETYTAGDVITVSVSVRNITAESGIHVVEFALFYDNEKLLLTNDLDEDDNNALVCIKDLPNGWESFSRVNNDGGEASNDGTVLPLNDGKIIASVLTEKATDKFAVKDDDVLVFTFNFKVLDSAEGDLGFVIPHATVDGALNTEAGAEIYEAEGDFAVLSKLEPVFVEAEEGVIEENAQLNVDTVESEDLEEVFPMIENIPSAIVFDIFIQKGDDRIQPNGELKISILAPVNVSAELRVYHIADDGKITDMNAVFENGYYTFTTTHLSYYMLANPDEMYKLGDVNNDGEIDKFDYIAVKRSVMNTITLNEIQQKAADVNISGDIEKFDYILIKRHVMGTYKIEG